eukprot:scaffold196178_cov14-Tisochrysis_lutea.AAC.2
MEATFETAVMQFVKGNYPTAISQLQAVQVSQIVLMVDRDAPSSKAESDTGMCSLAEFGQSVTTFAELQQLLCLA